MKNHYVALSKGRELTHEGHGGLLGGREGLSWGFGYTNLEDLLPGADNLGSHLINVLVHVLSIPLIPNPNKGQLVSFQGKEAYRTIGE